MCRTPVVRMQDDPFGFDASNASTHNKIHLSAVSNDSILPNRTPAAVYYSNRHEVTYKLRSDERRYYFVARFVKEKQRRSAGNATAHDFDSAHYKLGRLSRRPAHFADIITCVRYLHGAHMITEQSSRRITTNCGAIQLDSKNLQYLRHPLCPFRLHRSAPLLARSLNCN